MSDLSNPFSKECLDCIVMPNFCQPRVSVGSSRLEVLSPGALALLILPFVIRTRLLSAWVCRYRSASVFPGSGFEASPDP